MLKIPFDEKKCRDLITLDTLHAYYGGPMLTSVARKLNTYSRRHKFLFPSFFLPLFLIFVCLSIIRLLPLVEMEVVSYGVQERGGLLVSSQRRRQGNVQAEE